MKQELFESTLKALKLIQHLCRKFCVIMNIKFCRLSNKYMGLVGNNYFKSFRNTYTVQSKHRKHEVFCKYSIALILRLKFFHCMCEKTKIWSLNHVGTVVMPREASSNSKKNQKIFLGTEEHIYCIFLTSPLNWNTPRSRN